MNEKNVEVLAEVKKYAEILANMESGRMIDLDLRGSRVTPIAASTEIGRHLLKLLSEVE